MGCRYGRDVDAVDGRGGIEGAEVARGGSGAAGYVEDFEGVRREGRVHYAVASVRGSWRLGAPDERAQGCCHHRVRFNSWTGRTSKKNRKINGIEGITSDLTRSHLLAGKLAHLKD